MVMPTGNLSDPSAGRHVMLALAMLLVHVTSTEELFRTTIGSLVGSGEIMGARSAGIEGDGVGETEEDVGSTVVEEGLGVGTEEDGVGESGIAEGVEVGTAEDGVEGSGIAEGVEVGTAEDEVGGSAITGSTSKERQRIDQNFNAYLHLDPT